MATIVCSWLTYPGVGERNQPVSLLTGGLPSGGFFRPLFQGRKLHNGYGGVSEKSPASAPVASLMRAPVFHSVASSILQRKIGT